MEFELILTEEPLQPEQEAARLSRSGRSGAEVMFAGIVRGTEGSATIQALHYEAFEAMARHQFGRIAAEIESRWPVEGLRVVHRLGRVGSGEPSLWVAVRAGHRAEAFAACQYLIDEMKRRVPIWKRPEPA